MEAAEATEELIQLTSSDSAAALPVNELTSGGRAVMLVTFNTAGTQTITATALGAALASGTSTGVVVSGTSLIAPPSIAVGSGFPGQVVTSEVALLSWDSTQSGKAVTVLLEAVLSDGHGHTIAMSAATLSRVVDGEDVVVGTLETARPIATVTTPSGSQGFKVRVRIPSAAAGAYSALLSYTVAP